MIDEKVYQIAISNVPGIGPVKLKQIMSHFTSVREVFETGYQKLLELGISEKFVEEITRKSTLKEAEAEYEKCLESGIDVLFYTDNRFPQRLNYYDDVPTLLYYRGTADLNHHRIVSIVGTRTPTPQGLIQCEQIVKSLSAHNALIISGLAWGIDAKAHQSAVDNSIPTVGVMATGQEKIYPAEHKKLAKEMLAKGGGLLTEFKQGVEVIREFFPMRNKIIAAMCDVLIVVESAAKGGSLISAEFANTYGKDVFAFPGRAKDEHAAGCNKLIKQHKAHLLDSIQDIEYIMRWNKKPKHVQAKLFVDLSDKEQAIINHIRHHGETQIDDLKSELGSSTGELAKNILQLEIKGLIKSLPGKRYICIN